MTVSDFSNANASDLAISMNLDSISTWRGRVEGSEAGRGGTVGTGETVGGSGGGRYGRVRRHRFGSRRADEQPGRRTRERTSRHERRQTQTSAATPRQDATRRKAQISRTRKSK